MNITVGETEPDEMESAIKNALNDLTDPEKNPDSESWSTHQWTISVKQAIADIAKNQWNSRVYGSGLKNADGGEWLFDLTCLKYEKYDGGLFLVCADVVLESEWDPDGTNFDFEKLLLARANHRVMVYTVEKRQSPEKKLEELLKEISICTHSQKGDRYLFSWWKYGTRGFQHAVYCIK